MSTFVFPGQGSQSKGMGGILFDEFTELTQKADNILGYSIKELCLEDPRRELNKTQFTQPALYVVNALSYYKKIAETGSNPDYLAGHSLGEFNALLAAECFDFETGLKLVKKRGALMGQAMGGGMAAILNSSREEIESILEKNGLMNIDIANYNTPSQIVISGLRNEIGEAQALFEESSALYYPLNTSGAFHSRYMQSARENFEIYLKQFQFSALKIPVISNVTAISYIDKDVSIGLAEQITSAVRWSESIQYLIDLGENDFLEIGDGDVLTKLVAQIRREAPPNAENKLHDTQGLPQIKNKRNALDVRPNSVANLTAVEKVKFWNELNAIGAIVKSEITGDKELVTRTDAVVLFKHRAAVYVEGYNGYFDLDDIVVI